MIPIWFSFNCSHEEFVTTKKLTIFLIHISFIFNEFIPILHITDFASLNHHIINYKADPITGKNFK